MSKTKKKILLSLLVWLILFGALEVSTRVYYAVKAPRRTQTSFYVSHPYCCYVPNPEHDSHGPQGFRGKKTHAPKHRGLRIACLGGSSTYGTEVSEPDSYPRRLEDALAAAGAADVDVINAGLAGHSSYNLLGLLALRIVDFAPDICLLNVGFNDAWNRLHFSGQLADNTHAQKSWEHDSDSKPLWRHSMFLDKVASKLGHGWGQKPHIHKVCWQSMAGDPSENWKSGTDAPFRRNLRSLVALCRAHGIRPIFCTQATDFVNHPVEGVGEAWVTAMDETTAALTQTLQELKVDLIDVRSTLSNRADLFADCLHMTTLGNRERADLITAWLKEDGALARAPRER